MGLFDPVNFTPAQKVNAQLLQQVQMTYRQLLTTYNQGMRLVWQNPDQLTPQQVMAALGTNAGQVVALAANLKNFINEANPGTITTAAPATLTINIDGTVTVGTLAAS